MNATGEYHIISGRINDIAWDGDSQRVIAVGDGRERFGHCITADTGNSVGEISGHSSQVNSVSIRQQRPLRAATVSDDKSLVFYHGAPFKFNTSLREQHSNFIYGVAFSPDGSKLVSVGADRKIWLYSGTTGEATGQIGDGEHKGSVFAVSWAKDSSQFVTASADQTVKIWDVEAGKASTSWKMGIDTAVSIPDHQVGVVWPAGRSDGLVISLSLSGDLNYLESRSPNPVKVVQGHQKNITAACMSYVGDTQGRGPTLWTGSYDGRVCSWDVATGTGSTVQGAGHSNFVSGVTNTEDGRGGSSVQTVGWDDTLRSIDPSTSTFTAAASTPTKTTGQPVGIATLSGARTIVATTTHLEVYSSNSKKLSDLATKTYYPTALAATSTHVAVGGDDQVLRIYSVASASSLELTHSEAPFASNPTALSFHSSLPLLLAAGYSNGKIQVFSLPASSASSSALTLVTNRWSSHTARVTSIAWNAAGTHAVSGALDTNVFIWSVKSPGRKVKLPNAHKDGVAGVSWAGGKDEGMVVTVGGDAAVKTWNVVGALA